jgi:hypothetical protein
VFIKFENAEHNLVIVRHEIGKFAGNRFCHSERSEESMAVHVCENTIGFFAALRMTKTGIGIFWRLRHYHPLSRRFLPQ